MNLHDAHEGEDTIPIGTDSEGTTYKCLICGDTWHEGHSL